MAIKASICLSTYNKPTYLNRVLASIDCQSPPFDFEVVVVDDGSSDLSTESVCLAYSNLNLRYYRINRESTYRNPSVARNVAYRMVDGEVLILQSDDVVHIGPAISKLVELLENPIEKSDFNRSFIIATVYNVDFYTDNPVYYRQRWYQFTGPKLNKEHSPNPTRPLFFLGAVYRNDVYAIGGCDEDFVEPGKDDVWFADCLIKGRGLTPVYTDGVIGHHLHHERPKDLPIRAGKSSLIYQRKIREARKTGIWQARGGSWIEEESTAVAPVNPI